MDHHLALWTMDVVLEVFDDAALAEGVETLSDCGGINEVSRADLAGDHLVDAANVDLPLS